MLRQATLSLFIVFTLLNASTHIYTTNDCDMDCCDVVTRTDSFNNDYTCCEMITLTCSISPGVVQISKKSVEVKKKALNAINQMFSGNMEIALNERELHLYVFPPPSPPGHMTPLRV